MIHRERINGLRQLQFLARQYLQQKTNPATAWRGNTGEREREQAANVLQAWNTALRPQQPSTLRFNPNAQLDLSQFEDRRDPMDVNRLALKYAQARQLRNQQSTGVGVNRNEKRKRY